MPRHHRIPSSTNVYHVVSRGVGFQNIFMDDKDRLRLFSLMQEKLPASEGRIYAWCYMTNHIHLVLNMEKDNMSQYMQHVLANYSRSFNRRHGRCGHLFQERYHSEPIEHESYLLSAIRYVHQNPWRSRLCTPDAYRWSSYTEYIGKSVITSTDVAMAAFGSMEAFVQYHRELPDCEQWRDYDTGQVAPDEVIRERIESELGQDALRTIGSAPPDEQAQTIRKMLVLGASQRQVQRLSGIGSTVIARAASSS